MNDTLKNAIANLKEVELTNDIVIPLVEKLHPGRIEYTHSTIEAGRDIISYGKDTIDRQHIICIQVKAIKISYGARAFMALVNVCKLAKTEGVTNVEGIKIFPHEVWLISSKPFPAQERKQVEETIAELAKNNIKIIALDELVNLIMQYLPDIASKYTKHSDTSVTSIISILSRNNESRAFGLPIDKVLEDFYIPVTLAPQANYAAIALKNGYEIADKYEHSTEVSLLDYSKKIDSKISPGVLIGYIKDDLRKKYCVLDIGASELVEIKHSINLKETINSNSISEFKDDYVDFVNYKKQLKKDKDIRLRHFNFSIPIGIELNPKLNLKKYIEQTKKAIKECPKILEDKYQKFITAYENIKYLDNFAMFIFKEFQLSVKDNININYDLLRIKVQKPDLLLLLSNFILIEGPPGGGKTTFLKILTISLLDKGTKVLYVQCSSITSTYSNKSLEQIVKNWSMEKLAKKWKLNECILVLDGLDESTFDLTDKILSENHKFEKVIVSARYAYKTAIREKAFNIGVALFSSVDRDKFFEKWYANNKEYLNKIKSLIKRYDDINYHTRLPLIATITATLIQNNYEPTTRSEIYNYRLDLLLSKWDRYRGISRLKIDNPSAKKKFLMTLAYLVHSDINRRKNFNIDDIKTAYELSLGDWGYQHDYNELLLDLTSGSGLILHIREDIYTLGHLSFQEHLVGEYLFQNNISHIKLKSYLKNDWWKEALLFYAAASGNITDLVNFVSQDEYFFSYANQLAEMASYAPYTAPGAIEIILEAIKLIDEEQINNN